MAHATTSCVATHVMSAPTKRWAPATRGAVNVDRLTMRRGDRDVLRDLSLAFEESAVTAIVGPSGVGKTTLICALNGLLGASSGVVSIGGLGRLDDAAVLREARRRTATVFQDHALIGRLRAIDNVLLGLADARHPMSLLPWPSALRERAAAALDEVGLLGKAPARVMDLSGGERQRVGIARALVRRPRLLLGDEPFASVDPALALRLGDRFRRLAAERGVTVILALHQLHLARKLADRIIGLADGRIAFDGPPAAFDESAEARVFPSTLVEAETPLPAN
jgi:phosphonate transport system ATP-binding protein